MKKQKRGWLHVFSRPGYWKETSIVIGRNRYGSEVYEQIVIRDHGKISILDVAEADYDSFLSYQVFGRLPWQ